MSAPVPFPSAALEALSREEAAAGNALRAQLRRFGSVESIESACASLLGEPLALAPHPTSPPARAPLAPDAVAVALSPHGREGDDATLVLEVEGALAAALAARVLDRPAPPWIAPFAAPSEALAGVWAAVVAAVARRVGARFPSAPPLRVVGAGSSASVLAATPPGWRARASVDATITFRAATYAARLSTKRAASLDGPTSLTRSALARLGAAPLTLDVVGCVAPTTRRELERWSPGDALLFAAPLFAAGAPARGPVVLAARSSDSAARATLREDGSLVLEDGVGAAPLDAAPHEGRAAEEDEMESATHDTDPLSRALGDAPVVVRVEIGAVELSALEWSRLGPGDVVSLQRRTRDPVTLRVGGAEMGRGELVEVDGELAVRLLTVSP